MMSAGDLARGLTASVAGLLLLGIGLEAACRIVEGFALVDHEMGSDGGDSPHFGLLNLGAPGLVIRDDVLGYRLRASATTSDVEYAVEYRINEQGFRGPPVATEKPPGTYRILALGGSTTFGWGVTEHDTYPALLQQVLLERCVPTLASDIDVINGGVPGYTSTQAKNRLVHEWTGYAPDAVLVMEGLNDLAAIASDRDSATIHPLVPQGQRARLLRWYSWIIAHSAFARLFDASLWRAQELRSSSAPDAAAQSAPPIQLRDVPTETQRAIAAALRNAAQARQRASGGAPKPIEVPPALLHVLQDNLSSIQRLAEPNGFDMWVLVPPPVLHDYMPDFIGHLPEPIRPRTRLSLYAREFALVRGSVRDWASARGVPTVDLEARFVEDAGRDDLYLSDGMHFTQRGNAVIAEAIYERVFAERCGTPPTPVSSRAS